MKNETAGNNDNNLFFNYTVEAFILWHYCNSIFQRKFSVCVTLPCFGVMYLVLWGFSCLGNVYLNLAAFTISTFFLVFFFFKVVWFFALFHTLIIYLSMSLGELIAATITSQFFSDYWKNWTNTESFLVSSVLCKVLYFLITLALIRLQKEKPSSPALPPDRGSNFLAAITICSIGVSVLLYTIGLHVDETRYLDYMLLFSTTLLLVILFLVYSLHNYNQKRNAMLLDLQLQHQKDQYLAKYNQTLITQDEARRTLIHDIRNHLLSIDILNQQKRYEELHQYIQSLIESEQLAASVRICDNDLLNATLLRYQTLCKEKELRLTTEIHSGCTDFLSDTDLTTLFCNLLDNAVTAAQKVRDGWISLKLEHCQPLGCTILTMNNSCQEEPPRDGNEELITVKKDPLHHGLGMKSIRRIAESYHGDLQTSYIASEHLFRTIVTLYPQAPETDRKADSSCEY